MASGPRTRSAPPSTPRPARPLASPDTRLPCGGRLGRRTTPSPQRGVTRMTRVAGRTPLLETRGVSKRFGAVQALDQVDFEVYAGEVVALVGDNGAGKSTLIKIISGIYTADAGEMWFDGQEARVHSPRDVARLGIATVYQDLALCDNLDVVANLYLGREQLGGLVALDERSEE